MTFHNNNSNVIFLRHWINYGIPYSTSLCHMRAAY